MSTLESPSKRSDRVSTVCPYCKKVFTVKSVDKHILEQLCRPLNMRSYCKSCNVSYATRQEYMLHLTSKDHMSVMFGKTMDPVVVVNALAPSHDVELRSQVLALDPYLTKDESSSVKNEGMGDRMLLKFNGSDQKISVDTHTVVELPKQTSGLSVAATKIIGGQELANESVVKSGFSYAELMKHNESFPEPNERQTKIIAWLAQWQTSGVQVMRDKARLIMEKLPMQDADYLLTHLRNSSVLTLPAKQVYCTYIDSLVTILINEINKGIDTFGGKNIFEFVAKITK